MDVKRNDIFFIIITGLIGLVLSEEQTHITKVSGVVSGVMSPVGSGPVGSGPVVSGDPCHRTVPCIANTLVADPSDCSMYWQCLEFGFWVNRTCLGDDQFDRGLRRCVRAGTAHCHPQCQLYCQLPKTCKRGNRAPDPFNCRRYYLCEYGNPSTWRRLLCPEGTKFDMTIMACVRDSSAVRCHPVCELDPCDGIILPCPKKGIRMAVLNYTAAFYECSDNDGQWIVRYCGVDKTFDYKEKVCSYTGEPHPGCPKTTPSHSTTTVTQGTTIGQERPTVLNHTLEQVARPVLEGGPIGFNCSVTLSERMFGSALLWYLSDVRVSSQTGPKFTITFADKGTVVAGSLTIDPLAATDSATVRCGYVSVGGLNSSRSREFAVMAKPTVQLSNMSATVTIGDHLKVTCLGDVIDTGAPGADDIEMVWLRNGVRLESSADEEISNDSPGKTSIKLRNIKTSNIYSCLARNLAGSSPRMDCDVTAVPKETPKCLAESASEVRWPLTAQGKTSRELCPGNSTGTAMRLCMASGGQAVWDDPNLNNCVDPQFQLVMDQISNLKSGLGADSPEVVSSVAESLAKQTNMSNSDGNQTIKPGNLNVSVSAITDLADLHEQQNVAAVSKSEVQSVVLTASNLLSANNAKSWSDVLKFDKERAVKIMKSLDKYTSYVAKTLPEHNLEKLGFEASNVVMTSEHWEEGNMTFPNTSKEWVAEDISDYVVITNDTLSEISSAMGERRLVVSSTYYKTLDTVLPSFMMGNIPSNATPVSRILSITVDDFPADLTFESPINLQFGIRESVHDRDNRFCSFWNYSSSESGGWSDSGCRLVYTDENVTSCQCDHMTNFAILVSRYRPNEAHSSVLSILTMIGLTLSIVCLVTTTVMYLMLWKSIKSDYALMLVNLCIALTAANLLFLVGIKHTESRVACATIAVVLHFLFLVAFFLMLAESVELLLYIVYVFHVHTRGETVALLTAAWGTPVIIIAICLGVTRGVGYGNKDFCWLSIDTGLIWAFLGPITAIIVTNLLILAIVLKKLNDSGRLRNEKKSGRMRSALWNMVVLAPILGLSWTFGLFAFSEATLAFQYIFTALNAFQGLFIFVFHCIFNKRVRDAFTEKFAVDQSMTFSSSTTSRQNEHSRVRKTSSSQSQNKFVVAEEEMSTSGVFKFSNITTQSSVASSHDESVNYNPSDITANSMHASNHQPRAYAHRLSLDRPDIVQTVPETSLSVANAGDEISRSSLGGENTKQKMSEADQRGTADTPTVRLRHEYPSYRL